MVESDVVFQMKGGNHDGRNYKQRAPGKWSDAADNPDPQCRGGTRVQLWIRTNLVAVRGAISVLWLGLFASPSQGVRLHFETLISIRVSNMEISTLYYQLLHDYFVEKLVIQRRRKKMKKMLIMVAVLVALAGTGCTTPSPTPRSSVAPREYHDEVGVTRLSPTYLKVNPHVWGRVEAVKLEGAALQRLLRRHGLGGKHPLVRRPGHPGWVGEQRYLRLNPGEREKIIPLDPEIERVWHGGQTIEIGPWNWRYGPK